MRKKLTIGLILSIILVSCLAINDPLQMLFDLLIGGIVPGLNISLGFLPSLGFVLALLWLIQKWVKDLQHHIIVEQTQLNKLDAKRREFTDNHAYETVKKKSVISARSVNQVN